MNNDLISRSALLADIQADLEEGGVNGMVAGALKRYVKRAPTIEADPVRHGRWLVDSRTGMSFCSECLDYAVEADTNYCPNCGADMRGDSDE